MNNTSDIEPSMPFQIGEWAVDSDSGRLYRDGDEIKLEPKAMEVLVYLAQHPGSVISHETLEAKIWTGTVVGYGAVPSCIIKLRKALGDSSRKPQYIETVSKKGYRLIAPVSQRQGEKQNSTSTQSVSANQSLILRNKKILFAGGAAAIVIFGWLLFLAIGPETSSRSGQASAKMPSVVVLPFKNLSNDPAQEHLSDGITDDLITDLSRVDSVRVIARQTSYFYKNSPVALEDVFRQLDVLYIVEGSVRKSGKRIRINVQLTNTEKGESIWAERFDTDTDNIFGVQDNIVKNVMKAMLITLPSKESGQPKSRGTKKFEAYDAFLVGQRQINTRSKRGYDQTINAYQRALQIDPNYARVYGAMAVAFTRGYRYDWSDLSVGEARERSLKFAKKAVTLDQSTPQIYWSLGYVHVHRREFDDAEKAAKQSVALSPNYADGYALLAYISNWRGKATDTESYIKKAIELNPRHTFQYPFTLGMAYYHQGRYQEALVSLKDALKHNDSALNPRMFLAAAYSRLGLGDEALWEINQININHPDVTISSLGTILPYEDKKYVEALADDLRKAGMS